MNNAMLYNVMERHLIFYFSDFKGSNFIINLSRFENSISSGVYIDVT